MPLEKESEKAISQGYKIVYKKRHYTTNQRFSI